MRKIGSVFQSARFTVLGAICAGLAAVPAHADMSLNEVIVDLVADKADYEDIEVWNSGAERMYVVAEPSEIKSPGLATETLVSPLDPAVLGLLVTPQRLILEPGERKLVRIAPLGPRPENDRVYRVAIKSVAGDIGADASALKILIGYDTLVIYRAAAISGQIDSERTGNRLKLVNRSNTATEVFDGKQCDAGGGNCVTLESDRLYPGESLEQNLPYSTKVVYTLKDGGSEVQREY